MAPKKKKAGGDKKKKPAGKPASKRKADDKAVSSSSESEMDPSKMSSSQKKKIQSNLASQKKNAEGMLAKHESGEVPLTDDRVEQLRAKLKLCTAYQAIKGSSLEKEELLAEFNKNNKGNLWGSQSSSFVKRNKDIEEGWRGYGHKLLKSIIHNCLCFFACGCCIAKLCLSVSLF